MYDRIETERLVLTVLDKESAAKVTRFLTENRELFSQYEPEKKEVFYTTVYQEYVLDCEYRAMSEKKYVRYYAFRKEDISQKKVIGTVSFGQLRPFPYSSGIVGYKVAEEEQGKGYGTEMVAAAVEWAFPYFGLHRLEAYVLEDNYASARLLEKCGFTQEGFCRSNLKVNGKWRDHRLYAKLERDFR